MTVLGSQRPSRRVSLFTMSRLLPLTRTRDPSRGDAVSGLTSGDRPVTVRLRGEYVALVSVRGRPQQEVVQSGALVLAQRREELVLDPPYHLPGRGELAMAGGGQADH